MNGDAIIKLRFQGFLPDNGTCAIRREDSMGGPHAESPALLICDARGGLHTELAALNREGSLKRA